MRNSDRGMGLLLALIILALLGLLASALVTATMLDSWMGANNAAAVQAFYLADAGILDSLARLNTPGLALPNTLRAASGFDGVFSPANRLGAFLQSDDQPFIAGSSRSEGLALTDPWGHRSGTYRVFLRNDAADGVTNAEDSNRMITLVSIGEFADTQQTLEVLAGKPPFPDFPATAFGIERTVEQLAAVATDLLPADAHIADLGNPGHEHIAVVNGDAVLDGGSGYGLLVVRGTLRLQGDIRWVGWIVVTGPGSIIRVGQGTARVLGGLTLRNTQGGDVLATLNALGPGDEILFDPSALDSVIARLRYVPIEVRER